MDFVIGLPISANCKSDSYNAILFIIEQHTKMVHYELVKVMIDISGLAKVIIDVIVHHYRILELIVTD